MNTDPGKSTSNVVHQAPGGRLRDGHDWDQVRWGRERHEGFKVGKFLQAPPFFMTADANTLPLVDTYRGRSVFIIGSGPSFGNDEEFPKDLLRQAGITTFGINNSPRTFRPDLWACVDTPANFMRSIWFDPKIMKFAPICHTQKKILDNDSAVKNGTLFKDNERWSWTKERVMDCPNMVYFRRNEHFKPDQYLWEDTINWGNSEENGGGRSVLLAVIRICYLLGFRRIFLLGVDFEMTKDSHYSFQQHRHNSSVSGNNSTYNHLMKRFARLAPFFREEGLQVFNCNPRSKLDVFPHAPYHEAIASVLKEEMHDVDVHNENTEGLYDREYRSKKRKEKKEKTAKEKENTEKAKKARSLYTDEERDEAQQKLNRRRALLDDAKAEVASMQKLEPSQDDKDDYEAWALGLETAQKAEAEARKKFRTAEDEKRWKHGEPLRHYLWTPDRGM